MRHYVDPLERPAFHSAIERPEDWPPMARASASVTARFSPGFLDAAAVAHERLTLHPLCESPIEVELGSTLATILRVAAVSVDLKFAVCKQEDQPAFDRKFILLVPQYKWKRYRYDFAVRTAKFPRPSVFIECDGKEFHSTAEQKANDARKNAEAKARHIHILRFTGSEIFRDPVACVREIAKYV